MNRFLVITIIVILAGGFAFHIQTEQKKQFYELQERCGKQGTKFFEKEYGGGISEDKNGQIIANYQNYYNATLNKCLFLGSSVYYAHKENRATNSKWIRLLDLNENRELGAFFKESEFNEPVHCDVAGKACHSETEWGTLIKPYMEDSK